MKNKLEKSQSDLIFVELKKKRNKIWLNVKMKTKICRIQEGALGILGGYLM